MRGAAAGQRLLVDIDTPDSELDSLVVLYDAEGNAIADNDDESSSFDSLLNFVLPADGDYSVTFGLDSFDVDTYAVNLRAGDVLGGSVAGSGSVLDVNDTAGREVHGSTQDASYIYPASSPLPGGAKCGGGPRRRAERAPLRDRDRLRGALRRHAIGIAQSIDPGNFETEETALILSDVVSDPPTADDPDDIDPSLNAYIGAGSDRVRFVGHGPGQHRLARGGPLHRELARRPVQ